MKDKNWNFSKKSRTIDVQMEGPITKAVVRRIKEENPCCKIIINGKKY